MTRGAIPSALVLAADMPDVFAIMQLCLFLPPVFLKDFNFLSF